ncbi:MAG: CPBP family intramembrane metalloprotease [Clostridia bacterium]|nr:CPBP family intramembrane metalloprotease [Clostridia bacterium]
MNGSGYNQNQFFHEQNNFFRLVSQAKKDIRCHAIRLGICILIFLSAPYVFSVGLQLTGLYNRYMEDFTLQYSSEMLLMVVFLFIPFFTVYLFAPKKDKKTIALSFEKPRSSLAFLLAIPFGLMLCFAGDYISSLIASIFEEMGITLTSVPDYKVPTSGKELFLYAFATIVPPAIIEEFTMRGVAMQPLRKYGDKFAIVMTALVFGLMHRNAVQGIFAFIAGLIFGYITISSNSVWPAVVIHALNNGFAVLVNVMMQTDEEAANKIYALVISVILVFGIFSAIMFFVIGKRNKLTNPAPWLPLKEKSSAFFFNIPMIISFVVMILYTVFGDL